MFEREILNDLFNTLIRVDDYAVIRITNIDINKQYWLVTTLQILCWWWWWWCLITLLQWIDLLTKRFLMVVDITRPVLDIFWVASLLHVRFKLLLLSRFLNLLQSRLIEVGVFLLIRLQWGELTSLRYVGLECAIWVLITH